MGGQFGVFGPILLIAFVWALFRWRRLGETGRMLAAFAVPVLLLMLVQSLVSRAHANWAAVAYISAAIMVTGWLLHIGQARWLKASLVLHLLASAVVLHGGPFIPLTGIDPWHRQRGWTALAAGIHDLQAQHPNAILLASDRKIAAQIMFYVRPGLGNMVKWNPDGHINDHYELTSNMESLKGRTALFLTRQIEPVGLTERFASITPLPSVTRLRPTRPPEVYYVFLLDGYRGTR